MNLFESVLAGSLKGDTGELVAASVPPAHAAPIEAALTPQGERGAAAGVSPAPAAALDRFALDALKRELLIAATKFFLRDRDKDPGEAEARRRRLRAVAERIRLPFSGATGRLIDLRIAVEYALKPWHSQVASDQAGAGLLRAIGEFCEELRFSAEDLAQVIALDDAAQLERVAELAGTRASALPGSAVVHASTPR